jgi:phosphoribosyl 1,2-cyclic phosphodiesterase
MDFYSIASGSTGNCIYIGSEKTGILVDAGISGKRVEEGLNLLNRTAKDLQGILITHEHSDHIKGVGVLARKHGIPIYATPGTLREIRSMSSIGKIDKSLFREIHADEKFVIEDLTIQPFRISHDAAEPVAYRVSTGGKSAAVCTDLGYYDEYIVEHLKGLNAVLLESNHDINMLQVGSYPYYLKQRILGKRGHLSNENAGKLLNRILHDGMEAVMLGHLSRENNYEELAFETVCAEITMGECPYQASDFPILVAKRDMPSKAVCL